MSRATYRRRRHPRCAVRITYSTIWNIPLIDALVSGKHVGGTHVRRPSNVNHAILDDDGSVDVAPGPCRASRYRHYLLNCCSRASASFNIIIGRSSRSATIVRNAKSLRLLMFCTILKRGRCMPKHPCQQSLAEACPRYMSNCAAGLMKPRIVIIDGWSSLVSKCYTRHRRVGLCSLCMAYCSRSSSFRSSRGPTSSEAMPRPVRDRTALPRTPVWI
jgi:hypothetical protein